jgi:membrane protease YdiL (CAAX protease family)
MTQIKSTSLSPFKLSDKLMNSHNQLSPIWKALLFILISVGLFFLISPLMPIVPKTYRNLAGSILLSVIGIGLTWLFVKKEGSNLAAAGFRLNRKWVGQLFVGILPGIPMMLLIVLIEGMVFNFNTSLAFNESFQWPAFLVLFQGVLWSSLFQEVFFRGYVFQTMLKQWGSWKAQLGMAIIFSLWHIQQGPLIIVTTFFFSFLFGLGYIRTRSLALPVGLHAGFYLSAVSIGTSDSPSQLFVRTIPDSSPLMTPSFIITLPTVLITILCCVVLYFYNRKQVTKVEAQNFARVLG